MKKIIIVGIASLCLFPAHAAFLTKASLTDKIEVGFGNFIHSVEMTPIAFNALFSEGGRVAAAHNQKIRSVINNYHGDTGSIIQNLFSGSAQVIAYNIIK